MNAPTFLSILKNFFKGLNDFNSEGRQGYIKHDNKGSGTHIDNYANKINNLLIKACLSEDDVSRIGSIVKRKGIQ